MEFSSETTDTPAKQPVRDALRRLGCAVLRLLRRTHILDPLVWLRILLMCICAALFFVLFAWLIWLLVLFQILYTLICGRPNQDLVEFAPKCARYAHDLLAFLTYADERLPWPFSSFNEEGGSKAQTPPEKKSSAAPPPKKHK